LFLTKFISFSDFLPKNRVEIVIGNIDVGPQDQVSSIPLRDNFKPKQTDFDKVQFRYFRINLMCESQMRLHNTLYGQNRMEIMNSVSKMQTQL
jgi:hypothetical protein